ncbi:MAG TPA: type II toxin-antitoxin system VapC family toxin [Microvirga sp.]|jgi:ribonuclease VapC|nr:type II toxin-antitoxin system VapC family toxin [Microvirga sp.]
MVVDTSALVALCLDEDDADRFEAALVDSPETVMSVANVVEAAMVLSRHGDAAMLLDPALERLGIRPMDVTQDQAWLARSGFRAYGKGSGHPARLNFGGCFAYALARSLDAPLLFKGDDFTHTDVKVA